MMMSEKSTKKPPKSVKHTEISALNLTGYSEMQSKMDNSMIAKKTKNALRKNVMKKMGKGPQEPPPVEIIEDYGPTQQEGGGSKTSKAETSSD